MSKPLDIIVVDDDRLVADTVADMLTALGHHVAGIAHQVSDLGSLLAGVKPDLITLDLNLGRGRDGLGVATVLEAGDPLAIVFVTGAADEAILEEIKALPTASLVLKPFTPEALSQGIALALDRVRQAKEASGVF